ncbi:MAG: sensor histidine kinase [Sphingomonas sp.]
MRFDDSLDTVLSADMATPLGAQSAWRQLVDLIGRGRAPASSRAMTCLQSIRDRVPATVRAASARALEYAAPPVELVRLFAQDIPDVAAPVLRGAQLAPAEWIALLPELGPRTRAVLRHRRDLDPSVTRALDSFGAADFVLADETPAEAPGKLPAAKPAVAVAPIIEHRPPTAPYGPSSFVSLGEAAAGLPAVAEALRHRERTQQQDERPRAGGYRIADLVERIDAFRRRRDAAPAELSASSPVRAESFRFETDAAGVVRWVDGVNRAPLIGLSLDLASLPGGSHVDGVASGAFRRRAGFANARLVVEGDSDAAGDWRITAVPAFDSATGRFTGYRGTARRPRADEQATPPGVPDLPPDSLRQLVHELRTPTNAIAGFAEMIEQQMLGPVADTYRIRAAVIRDQARELLTAIEDLDLAARIEGKALDLRAARVVLAPLLARVAADLDPLAALRGTAVVIDDAIGELAVAADERAVERLVGRLLAVLVAAGARDEQIGVTASADDDRVVIIHFDRPAALTARADEALFAIDAEDEAASDGAPLLGTGFALRLVRNLAGELGGSFTLGERRLTLRLPAAVTADMGQASTN